MSKPIISLQVGRAVAALAVLTGHIWPEFGTLGVPSPIPPFNQGAAGVDLFFVISGFVMVYSTTELAGQRFAPLIFAARRLARIMPLYWLVTTSYLLLLLYFFGTVTIDAQSTPSIIRSYFLWPYPRPNGTVAPVVAQGWTLYFEMFFYAIFALSLFFGRRWSVIAALIMLVAVYLSWPNHIPENASVAYFFNPIVIEFAFGMLLCLVHARDIRIPSWLGAVLIIVGVAVILFPPIPLFVVGREWQWGIPSAMMIAGMVLGRWGDIPGKRVATLLGDCSYALYLMHGMVFFVIRTAVAPRMDVADHRYAYTVVLVAAAIMVSIATHQLIDWPIQVILKSAIKKTMLRIERRETANYTDEMP